MYEEPEVYTFTAKFLKSPKNKKDDTPKNIAVKHEEKVNAQVLTRAEYKSSPASLNNHLSGKCFKLPITNDATQKFQASAISTI